MGWLGGSAIGSYGNDSFISEFKILNIHVFSINKNLCFTPDVSNLRIYAIIVPKGFVGLLNMSISQYW